MLIEKKAKFGIGGLPSLKLQLRIKSPFFYVSRSRQYHLMLLKSGWGLYVRRYILAPDKLLSQIFIFVFDIAALRECNIFRFHIGHWSPNYCTGFHLLLLFFHFLI